MDARGRKAQPPLAVMAANWRVLTTVPSNAGTNWTRVSFLPEPRPPGGRVRLEWFPAQRGQALRGHGSTSWLDEVSVKRLAQTPPELARALDLDTLAGERADGYGFDGFGVATFEPSKRRG